ncbi:MAG: DUF1538 domain-containing protein [Nitrospina sp.]|jgi:hypothetical protein|nr:DUF1538 domain-containing protein [Nitrospina sp.]MBT5632723.1 DUF1538 domain-containing protein [Nitrospina sp.]
MNSEIFNTLIDALGGTLQDILPIIIVLGFFQVVAIQKVIPHLKQKLIGLGMVVLGLGIFIVGLEQCVFPIGSQMANQLTDLNFLAGSDSALVETLKKSSQMDPGIYLWTYIFAFLIGFSTTLAEPALIAVAYKARDITTGAISAWGLRVSVALGVATGVTLGVYRIVMGNPLHYYIVAGYAFLLIQTWFSPKQIIPLAYDSGGVTTSTVTVPLIAALGIGLASNVPGRSPLIDGFGLIAFASLFPMITVMAYAMITEKLSKRKEINEPS